MDLRGLARRLPLAGAAVAGAVVGHGLAYALAVPEPGRRLAVLAGSGHAYWSAAIAAAIVLGLGSLGATLARSFRAGLRPQGRPAGPAHGPPLTPPGSAATQGGRVEPEGQLQAVGGQ